MKPLSVLLVEDEPRLAEFTKRGLEECDFQVDVAYDGQIGKTLALSNQYNLMIFDVNLPKINGFELIQIVRAENITTPILMLTAMGSTQDKITGLEAGADDYLVKPYDFHELIARLNALYRRSHERPEQKKNLQVGDLILDLNQKIAVRNGKSITLTAREFALLEYMMKNKGKVISRVEIAEKVWHLNFDTGTNTIDVYVNFLRNKVDKNFPTKLIHTVIGMGYILKD